jgi:hypothetical protein
MELLHMYFLKPAAVICQISCTSADAGLLRLEELAWDWKAVGGVMSCLCAPIV